MRSPSEKPAPNGLTAVNRLGGLEARDKTPESAASTEVYLASKTGVTSEIKLALSEFRSTLRPEMLERMKTLHDVLPPNKLLVEYLASADATEAELQQVIKEWLPSTVEYFEFSVSFYQDLPRAEELHRFSTQALTYFSELADAGQAEQLRWAKKLRDEFLAARVALENELSQLEADLREITPAEMHLRFRPLKDSMITVSRLEWVSLVPHLFEDSILDMVEPDGPLTPELLARDLRRRTALTLAGFRTFPNLQGESCAITVLDTWVGFEEGKVVVKPGLTQAQRIQRHEALHHCDELEMEDLPDSDFMLVKMGFRQDLLDLQKRQLVRPLDQLPRAAVEEGLAVLFDNNFADEITNPYLPAEYLEAAQLVRPIIDELGGVQEIMRVRLNHDFTPVLEALRSIDPDGRLEKRLKELTDLINLGLVT